MAGFVLDSSALVKRYIREAGTDWVRSLTHRGAGNQLYLARITAVEVTSAVARRRRGGSPSPSQASSILHRFRKHLAGRYTSIEMTPAVVALAMKLANAHNLRAYDAVQLASAVEVNRVWVEAGLGPLTLVSADRELNDAARAEGLAVDDPSEHP
jgi:predicted nucleic acid-binding protein